MLTEPTLRRLWPHVDEAKPGLIAAVVAAAPAVFAKYGLTTDVAVAQAMAQFSEEFGADMPASRIEFAENLNYTADSIQRTWPGRFSSAEAAAPYAHNPRALGNAAYNGRMGNRLGTDDGYNFRGRGGSQVTGRDGYAALGAKVGLDLIANPDLVCEPAHFLECAVADFVLCGCLPYALQDNLLGVSSMLNVGHLVNNPRNVNGYDARAAWLARWKLALLQEDGRERPGAPAVADPNASPTGTKWVQVSLNKLILRPEATRLAETGVMDDATRAMLRAFQDANGLPVTGLVDDPTCDAIDAKLAKLPHA
jgi:putative chitinase